MRGESETQRKRLLEELKGLFGPAFGPALEAYGRSFAERISQDAGFRAEVRDRFERGRSLGGFPELSALIGGMSEEELEEFFESGWTDIALPPSGPSENPWDWPPWEGDIEAYRQDLYAGMAFSFADLRSFAREWLDELRRVGYYGMEESLGLPLKQQADSLSPTPTDTLPLYGAAYPVRFPNTCQTIWLDLHGPRSEEGQYREVLISEEPLRTDSAIFAALSALEGRQLDIGLLREALPEIVPLRGESVWDRWTKVLAGENVREKLPDTLRKLRHHQTLDYVLMLLRYHRPGFDDRSLEERTNLIAETCVYINEFLEVLRKLMAFVEYGMPGRRAVPAVKSIARDIKAAILKDVDGLTYREIGEKLGVPPPADFGHKGDYSTVRKMVSRGRNVFQIGLGVEGWQGQISAMQAESNRRYSLSDPEREAEDLSEVLHISFEEALELVEEEKVRDQERGEEPGIA